MFFCEGGSKTSRAWVKRCIDVSHGESLEMTQRVDVVIRRGRCVVGMDLWKLHVEELMWRKEHDD